MITRRDLIATPLLFVGPRPRPGTKTLVLETTGGERIRLLAAELSEDTNQLVDTNIAERSSPPLRRADPVLGGAQAPRPPRSDRPRAGDLLRAAGRPARPGRAEWVVSDVRSANARDHRTFRSRSSHGRVAGIPPAVG